MSKKVIAIVGSYRKGQIIDTAVSAILDGAKARGGQTEKIYLLDKHIEFCTNCRKCTQEKEAGKRAKCIHNDDMDGILQKIDDADGVVFGAPVNYYNVTAIMRRFIERMLPYGYWPWGRKEMPKYRIKKPTKKAVILTSSACPAFFGRIFMPGAMGVLKIAAKSVGAKVVRSLYFGMVGVEENQQLSKKDLLKAYKAGEKLVS
jgi:putative NADPH-quinone reductase